MFFGHNRIFSVIAIIGLVFAHSGLLSAGYLPVKQLPLPTGEITFDPPFATVRERSELVVTLEVTDPDPELLADTLILEKQRILRSGFTIYEPIGRLRDDGEKNDALAGDRIFTGVVSLYERVTGAVRLRAVGRPRPFYGQGWQPWQPNERLLRVSRTFSVEAYLPCGPTGNILPVTVFEADREELLLETVEFEVPQGGEAVLRLVNGARIGSALRERLPYARVEMNGERVAIVRGWSNVLEKRVELEPGINILDFQMAAGRSGQRLSARVDACADEIVLQPIVDSLIAGGDPLQAVAKVTALGAPVANANVLFTLSEIGTPPEVTEPTSDSGVASAFFEIQTAGNGTLQAAVVGAHPPLVAESMVQAVTEPAIVLNQSASRVTLDPESESQVSFFIFYLAKDGLPRHVVFEQSIEPDTGGITLTNNFPPGGFVATGPANLPPVEETIGGVVPGHYTVTSRARIQETGESSSVELAVEVVEAGAPDPLVLGNPKATPSGVEPEMPTTVIFRAQVDGTSTPPPVLFLDELDLGGEPLELAVAELRDEGSGEDAEAGDRIYTGALVIDREASELRFRVRAAYFGEEVVSGASAFLVTPFPRQARPSDPQQLVPVPGTPSRFFANEVEVKVIPGVSVQEMEGIAASIGGTVVGVIPSLRIYLIEFPGDGSANGVAQAIATLLSFSQVESAAPNVEVVDAAIDFNFPPECTPPTDDNGPCPNDGNHPDQWYLDTIGARRAWELVGGGDSAIAKVAAIEGGGECGHEDLSGRCTVVTGEIENPHATAVAGVIAANANNNMGIAGVAWDTELLMVAGALGSSTYALKDGIADATATDAKIINITQAGGGEGNLKEAICGAVDAGKLVVAAGGNILVSESDVMLYPAGLNSDETAPCSSGRVIADQLLAVGGSNQSDGRATWSVEGIPLKSNDAAYLDIYAPGVDIRTLTGTGGTSGVTTKSGTSLSAAQVAGAAAVLWAHDDFATPAGETRAKAVADRLKASGDTSPTICATCKRLNLATAVEIPTKKVTINFVSESADFRNLFGIYDRSTLKARILIENVDLGSDPDLMGLQTELFLTDTQSENLEFFLVPDGADFNAAYLASTPPVERDLVVFEDTDGTFRVKDQHSETVLRGSGEDVFFSEPSRNPDGGADHVRETGSANDVTMGWEDLPASGWDADFNDAVFRITTTDHF